MHCEHRGERVRVQARTFHSYLGLKRLCKHRSRKQLYVGGKPLSTYDQVPCFRKRTHVHCRRNNLGTDGRSVLRC